MINYSQVQFVMIIHCKTTFALSSLGISVFPAVCLWESWQRIEGPSVDKCVCVCVCNC